MRTMVRLRSPQVQLKDSSLMRKPQLHSFEREGVYFFVDPQSPNWISTDERGAKLLNLINGKRNVGEIRNLYANLYNLDWGKGWIGPQVFLREAARKGIVSLEPFDYPLYEGRSLYLKPETLKEFWIHLLQTCNLSCSHCLVSSNPKGPKGAKTDFYIRMISPHRSPNLIHFC